MPSFDRISLTDVLQNVITVGTLVIGSVAIVYSLIFLGGRVVTPRTIRRRLGTAIAASFLVIALAALDIYLAVPSH